VVIEMKIIKHLWFRIYQKIFYFASYVIGYREPVLIRKKDGILDIPMLLKSQGKQNLFLVVDQNIFKLGLIDSLIKELIKMKINITFFDGVKPDPDIKEVLKAKEKYIRNKCDAIVSIGGGSAIDLAKACGVLIARPKRDIQKMKGVLKVGKKLPFHIAVPTTVGTGSEGTLAAVVSNYETNEKYAIMDPVLIPDVALLDTNLVKNLPKNIIANTAMDALTHAIEAYVGKANTGQTKKQAELAIQLILGNALRAYEDQDEAAISNLHYAAYLAGLAFTRAYVGNVHAIAHTLGGFYHIPHGLANAVVLPHVLDYYDTKIKRKIKKLGKKTDIFPAETNEKDQTIFLIDTIRYLNKKLSIPTGFKNIILEKDLEMMVDRAYKEANPLYPVPMIFSKTDFLHIYQRLMLEGTNE